MENYMPFQKRFVSYLILGVILIFSLACQSVSRILSKEIPASKNTPEFPINGMDYDGNWKGTTSQGFEVTFTVYHNGITTVKVQGNWDGQNCRRNFETNVEVNINPTAEALGIHPTYPIKNGAFTIAYDGSKTDGTAYNFVGTFLSTQEALGTIEYAATSGSCQGTKKFDWTAMKIAN